MARQVLSITGDNTSYIPDRGGAIASFSGRVGKPADIAVDQFDTILAAANLRRKVAADRSPCPEAADVKFRKLKFTREDGNSFSLPLFSRGAAAAVGFEVAEAIQAFTPTNRVLCVELIGEEWADLTTELRLAATGAPVPGPISRSPNTLGRQLVHSGKIPYEYDGFPSSTAVVTVAAKVDTDAFVLATGVTLPPTILGTAWAGCVGPFQPENPCPSSSSIDSRRYIVTLLAIAPGGVVASYQRTEVPVRQNEPTEVLECGQALANLPPTTCLGYRGESNKRFHRLIPGF